MKNLVLLVLIMFFALPVLATDESKQKPTQHLKLSDVKSMKEAKEIFLDKTIEIRGKKNISITEAAEIHIITYTLEKSVAYFAENLTGEKQKQAKEIAEVVEKIHLTSESNQLEKLKMHLKEYSKLVDEFLFCF
jgi:hypothetical protein